MSSLNDEELLDRLRAHVEYVLCKSRRHWRKQWPDKHLPLLGLHTANPHFNGTLFKSTNGGPISEVL